MNNRAQIATQQFLLKNLYWKTTEQLAWRFNLNAINDSIKEIGASTWTSVQSTTNVLFVTGEKSEYIDVRCWNEIKQSYTKGQLVEIAGAGHWVQVEKPVVLLDKI